MPAKIVPIDSVEIKIILLNTRIEEQFYLKFLTKLIMLVQTLALLHVDCRNIAKIKEIPRNYKKNALSEGI